MRVLARIAAPLARPRKVQRRDAVGAAFGGERRAWLAGRELRVRLVERASLRVGDCFEGPAIVQEFSGTTLVPPKVRASVTAGGHLLLQRRSAAR